MYKLKGYIVATDFFMDEYGVHRATEDGSRAVAYYGPEIVDKRVLEEQIIKALGLPKEITIGGSFGRPGTKRSPITITSELYDYEVIEDPRYSIFIEWVNGEFVYKDRARLHEKIKEMKQEKYDMKVKEQIEAFDSLTDEEKIDYITSLMGSDTK